MLKTPGLRPWKSKLSLTAIFLPIASFAFQPAGYAQTDLSRERLIQLSEPAVVRILDGCRGTYQFFNSEQGGLPPLQEEVISGGSGSGFVIHPNGYIATNAHVVSNTDNSFEQCEEDLFEQFVARLEEYGGFEPGSYSDDEESKEFIRQRSRLVGGLETINRVVLPNGETFPFRIESFGDPIDDENTQIRGKDVAIIKIEVQDAPTLKLSDSSLPEPASDIIVLGYPSEADIDILDIDSSLQMSNIPGNVSAIKKTADGVNVIQISASVSTGISGGPVLNTLGEVVGMISFGVQDVRSGTGSIPNAVPTSTIEEFIGDAGGIQNQQGEVDRLYRQGLEELWNKDYKSAIITFEQVKGLFEYHSEADDLIAEARRGEFIIDSNPREVASTPFNFSSLTWIVTSTVLGLVAAGIGVLVGKQYFRNSRLQVSQDATRVTPPLSDPSIGRGSLDSSNSNNKNDSALTPWIELEYNGQVRRFYLKEGNYKLGRDSSWADLEIPNDWNVFSGRHAVLEKIGSEYRIYDGDGQGHSSSNGLVNTADGEKIGSNTGYPLKNGTQLNIGHLPNDHAILTFFNPASARRTYDPTRMA
ncbi:trypsin-like peptidase domain-containing protein [Nodosilinea sp. LEGE 07298]|uniref:trypsin-like peptidase domain-containing protein n=1 Tax=Nodosilinea sp. LEGE 07298 TaxID=2777970 RepID=UPI00187E5F2B|nr:trypsin-like peptidase domain-containing protein [Nodosilinea sp. LEGE 07298]MBE9109423.1 trypsin-like peptidase domain-containing protein [Nodosilinea sp. LEGE 07298]